MSEQKEEITQAVIASGGEGTRLRPATERIPKVMLRLRGKPLLEYHVEQFKRYGVREFFFTLGYLPGVVEDYFGDGAKWGVRINYFVEERPLGPTGGLKALAPRLGREFFFIYGDTYSEVDYARMAAAFAAKPGAVAMQRVARLGFREDVDLAELGPDLRFKKIYGKPHAERRDDLYSMRGIFIFKKEVLAFVPEGKYFEVGRGLLPALLVAGKPVYGYECAEYSKGIDTPEKLREVETRLVERAEGAPVGAPAVSVLLVTADRGDILRRAIESVRAQTFFSWELVVVDDSTDDRTEQAVREFAADRRIRYFRRGKRGRIGEASNFGLAQARGAYVAIIDDDDWWTDPRKLEKQIAFLEAHREYAGCGGGFLATDERGNERFRTLKPETDEAIRRRALYANPMANSTTLFRRAAALAAGGYDETLPEFADWDFWLKLGERGKLYNFPEYFSAYRMWGEGASFARQRGAARAAFRIVARHRGHYPRYAPALLLVCLYAGYAFLPGWCKKFLNAPLSRAKKTLFAK